MMLTKEQYDRLPPNMRAIVDNDRALANLRKQKVVDFGLFKGHKFERDYQVKHAARTYLPVATPPGAAPADA